MENPPQAPLNRSPGKEGKKRFPVKRTIALVLFLFLLIGIGLHAPVKEYVSSVQESAQKIIEFGWKGHIIFLFGVTFLILMGMPRLLFCAIGGMAFGWWLGLIYAVAATLLAYYLQFLFVRWGGRPFVEKYSLYFFTPSAALLSSKPNWVLKVSGSGGPIKVQSFS